LSFIKTENSCSEVSRWWFARRAQIAPLTWLPLVYYH